jgi:hypothetical protein
MAMSYSNLNEICDNIDPSIYCLGNQLMIPILCMVDIVGRGRLTMPHNVAMDQETTDLPYWLGGRHVRRTSPPP